MSTGTADRFYAAMAVHSDHDAVQLGQMDRQHQPNILVSAPHGGLISGIKGGELSSLVTSAGAVSPHSESLIATWDRLINDDSSDLAQKLVAGMALEMSVALTSAGHNIPVGSLRVTTSLAPNPITSMPLVPPSKRIQSALRLPGSSVGSLVKELGVGPLSAAQMAVVEFVRTSNTTVTLTGLTDAQTRMIKSRYTGVTEAFVFSDQRNTHIHRLASLDSIDDVSPSLMMGVSAQDVSKGKPAVVIVPFGFPAQSPIEAGGHIHNGQLQPSDDGYTYAHEWGSVAAHAALDVSAVISAESITYAMPKSVSAYFTQGFADSIGKASSAIKREVHTTDEFTITRLHMNLPAQRDRILTMEPENLVALEPALVHPVSPFRSRLYETIDNYMTDHAPAHVLRQMLSGWVKSGRVHQDEIEQSGLDDALRIVGQSRVNKEGVLSLLDALRKDPKITHLTGDKALYSQSEFGSNTVDAYREILVQHASISPREFAEALYGGDSGINIQADQSGVANAYAKTALSPVLTSPAIASSMPDTLVRAMARSQWQPQSIAPQDIPQPPAIKSWRLEQGAIHFPEHESLVAHLRAGMRYGVDGKPSFHILEAQSDWAKMLRQYGSTDDIEQYKSTYLKAKNQEEEIFKTLVAKLPLYPLREKWQPARTQRSMIEALHNHLSDPAGADLPQQCHLTRKLTTDEKALLQDWHNASSAMNQAASDYDDVLRYGMPKGPWVRHDNAWGKLALAVALREAVLVGAKQLSWDAGEIVNRRFSLPNEAGLKGLYDRTLPHCARKLIRQHGASSVVEKAGDSWRFEITPELAQSVSNGMYAYHQLEAKWRNAPTSQEAIEGHAAVVEREIGYLFGPSALEALKITVLPAADSHPSHEALPSNTVGFFDQTTRQTFLIADRIAPSLIRPLVLHEVGVHHGLSMMGEKGQRILEQVTDMLQNNDVAAMSFANDVSQSTTGERYTEEVLALMAMQPPSTGSHPADQAKSCIRAFLSDHAPDIQLQPHDIPFVAEGWLHRVRQNNLSPAITTSRHQLISMLSKHQSGDHSIAYKIVEKSQSDTPNAYARKAAAAANISHSRLLLGDFTVSEQNPAVIDALLRAGAATSVEINDGITGLQAYEKLRRQLSRQLTKSNQHLSTQMTNELLAELGVSGMTHGEVGEMVVFDSTPDAIEPYLPFSNSTNAGIRAITLAVGEGSGLQWSEDGILHDGESKILKMEISNGDLYVSEIADHPLAKNALSTIVDSALRYSPVMTLAIETGFNKHLQDFLATQNNFQAVGTELQLPLRMARTTKDFDQFPSTTNPVITTASRLAQRVGDAIFVADSPLATANLACYESEHGAHHRLAGLQPTTPLIIPIDCGEYVAVSRRVSPETGVMGWAAARCDKQGDVVAEYLHADYQHFQRFMSVLTNRSNYQLFHVELVNEHGDPTPEGQFLTHNLINWISEQIEIDPEVVALIEEAQRRNDIHATHAYLKAIAPGSYQDAMDLMGVTTSLRPQEARSLKTDSVYQPA